MKAIRLHQTGGPEVLQFEDVPDPAPGPGDAAVKIEAAGVNFIDIYFRSGLYKTNLPFTSGQEGAGVVSAVGSDVSGFQPGDRVTYTGVPGSYAEYAVVPADKLVKLPDGIDTRTAAAITLQGMTVHYFELLDLSDRNRAHCSDTRRRWRGGPATGSSGKNAWCASDRNVLNPRKGSAGSGSRSRRVHPLYRAGLCRRGQTPHRWQRCRCGLRFGRQNHLGRQPQLPSPPGLDGVLRQCQRALFPASSR